MIKFLDSLKPQEFVAGLIFIFAIYFGIHYLAHTFAWFGMAAKVALLFTIVGALIFVATQIVYGFCM